MPYYRVYHFASGGISTFDEFDAADDIEAIEVARPLVTGEKSELWQRGRFVAVLRPADSSA